MFRGSFNISKAVCAVELTYHDLTLILVSHLLFSAQFDKVVVRYVFCDMETCMMNTRTKIVKLWILFIDALLTKCICLHSMSILHH